MEYYIASKMMDKMTVKIQENVKGRFNLKIRTQSYRDIMFTTM